MEDIAPSDEEKELIRNRLVVSHKEVFDKLLQRVEKLISLDEHGNVHLGIPTDRLAQGHIIALHLLGRKYAHMVGIASEESMTNEELANAIGTQPKTARARISELKERRWVQQTEPGKHRIAYMAIENLLDEIEERRGEG